MKRRTFLLTTTTIALVVISVPAIKYFRKKIKYYDPLMMPDTLSRFCDEKTIREMGMTYRKMMPGENEKKKLKGLLLTDFDGKIMAGTDEQAVFELLDKKIFTDFSNFKIQILNGWVISTTEARQCALFSLT